jgi:hypothetical protein
MRTSNDQNREASRVTTDIKSAKISHHGIHALRKIRDKPKVSRSCAAHQQRVRRLGKAVCGWDNKDSSPEKERLLELLQILRAQRYPITASTLSERLGISVRSLAQG